MEHSRTILKLWLFTIFLLSLFLSACQPTIQNTPTALLAVTETERPISTNTAAHTPEPTNTFPPTATLAPESDFIKGVWFVDWGLGDGVDTLDGQIVLRDIVRPLGANWIAIQIPCNVDVRDLSVIQCNYDNSLPDSAIVNVTNYAHSLGLRVALFPFVMGFTDENGVPDNWSAGLNFGRDQNAWDMYFQSYANVLLPYAEIAEQNKMDLFIMGGEQTEAQSQQEEHWRELVRQLRGVYHGPITYDAWCQHFKSVQWWDELDYIGVNLYCFPLAKNLDPDVDEVKSYYKTYFDMVKAGSVQWNKPVIFSEIGYLSVHGISRQAPFGFPPVLLDTAEQGTLVQAFFEALQEFGYEDGWLKGLFWYNFSSNPLQGGLGDINFAPHNKPAEAYIRSFYTGQPVKPVPPLRTQVEEDAIAESYWLFRDAMENRTQFGQWVGDKQSIVSDPLVERSDVISVKDIVDWEGLQLNLSNPADMRAYDFLEFYFYAPRVEPNLELRFDDTFGQFIPRRLYIRNFIDQEPLLDGKWHRIQIPLDMLFPEDRDDIHYWVSSIYLQHFWPGNTGGITFYVDDIRLIKVK